MTVPPPALLLLDIGPMEFLVLAATAVMLFGGDLPDVMRRAGRLVTRLRGMAADLGRSANLRDDVKGLTGAAREITGEIASLPREVTAEPPPRPEGLPPARLDPPPQDPPPAG